MRGRRAGLLVGAALVLCPCHLPLLAALLAGTALGAVLAENLGTAVLVASAGFVGVLLLGSRLLDRGAAEPACPTCETIGETELDGSPLPAVHERELEQARAFAVRALDTTIILAPGGAVAHRRDGPMRYAAVAQQIDRPLR